MATNGKDLSTIFKPITISQAPNTGYKVSNNDYQIFLHLCINN
jgi:hypothetical protein